MYFFRFNTYQVIAVSIAISNPIGIGEHVAIIFDILNYCAIVLPYIRLQPNIYHEKTYSKTQFCTSKKSIY